MLTHTCPSCAAKTRKIAELERLLDGAIYHTKREAARLVYSLGMTTQEAELLTILYRSGLDFVNRYVLLDALPALLRTERVAESPSNHISVLVTRIRKKLGADSVQCAYGFGYRLGDDARKRVAEILEAK